MFPPDQFYPGNIDIAGYIIPLIPLGHTAKPHLGRREKAYRAIQQSWVKEQQTKKEKNNKINFYFKNVRIKMGSLGSQFKMSDKLMANSDKEMENM